MKVFSIIGVSLSGKTTAVEALITELRRRNYRVGTVKDIHFEDFAMDVEGSNTHRHKMAGSELVVARGIHETDILYQRRLTLKEILSFFDHDFVILEGPYDFLGPGIIAAHTGEEIDERRRDLVFAVTGMIAEHLNEYKGLPVINSLTEAGRLADLVEVSVPEWDGQEEWLGKGGICEENKR